MTDLLLAATGKMSAIRLVPRLVALLGMAWTTLAQSGSTATLVNMDFNYSFFEGTFPSVNPTDAELSHLVCETQQWVSQHLQNTTLNPTLTMKAVNIGYERGVGPNLTDFVMFFTGEFNTAPGGDLPTDEQIIEAMTLTQEEKERYITDYVYSPPSDGSLNYWRDIDTMAFKADFGSTREGLLDEATCDATIAPTFPGGEFSTSTSVRLSLLIGPVTNFLLTFSCLHVQVTKRCLHSMTPVSLHVACCVDAVSW